MIETDISNVWNALDFNALVTMEARLNAAHTKLADGIGLGSDLLGWYRLPGQMSEGMLDRIRMTANKIRKNSKALVVVGSAACCYGIKGALEFLNGTEYNVDAEVRLFFAGEHLSGRAIRSLSLKLQNLDFSVLLISEAESRLETSLAARTFRWLLNRKYGPEKARERIYAVCDPNRGKLHAAVLEEGWTNLPLEDSISERFCLLSVAGLLPLAVAGADIRSIMAGARSAEETLNERSMDNPVWLYAGIRTVLSEGGRTVELLCSGEPGLHSFGMWWQQLMIGSEAADGNVALPVMACYPPDMYALGLYAQSQKGKVFETYLRFEPDTQSLGIELDWKNIDGLNKLAGKSMEFAEDCAYEGALQTQLDHGVPAMILHCGKINSGTLGQLVYFMQLAAALSGYMRGLNPFKTVEMKEYQEQTQRFLGW